MFRISPQIFLILAAAGVLLFFLGFILEKSELIDPVPRIYVKVAAGFLLLMFFWWPVDMLIHWEKRTPASMEKDKYIAMITLTVILFVFPFHFWATPLWPTLLGAVLIGLGFPLAFVFMAKSQERTLLIEPERVYRLGMESPKAQEFCRFFPDAHAYAIGLTPGDGLFAKLILHHRESAHEVQNGWIDYVLEVPVHRKREFYIGGQEVLQCYLFINEETRARVGFLPSANMHRAYDYGFSEDELEHALEEAGKAEQNWPPLGDQPLLIQHYPGKAVPVK